MCSFHICAKATYCGINFITQTKSSSDNEFLPQFSCTFSALIFKL